MIGPAGAGLGSFSIVRRRGAAGLALLESTPAAPSPRRPVGFAPLQEGHGRLIAQGRHDRLIHEIPIDAGGRQGFSFQGRADRRRRRIGRRRA